MCRYHSSPYGSTTRSVNGHKPRIALPVREAVEQQVVRIMKALLLGSPGEKRCPRVQLQELVGWGAMGAGERRVAQDMGAVLVRKAVECALNHTVVHP